MHVYLRVIELVLAVCITRVESHTEKNLVVGKMPDFELLGLVNETQCCKSYLFSVLVAIALWKARNHHVGIAYGLYLKSDEKQLVSLQLIQSLKKKINDCKQLF